ncbi:GrpB family protein [Rossellomorea sp. NS-SX7]|uniref:GrpB family protein n=1 Tax=Rossellomorea sp. NS-SX7 TaxID=3463856 RepID=UPI00405A468A
MNKPEVEFVDYNPRWPAQFEMEQKKILEAAGEWVIAVEHIGSTSVTGLASKPIIDILAGVRQMEDAEELIKPLKLIDYECVPKPQWEDRRFFRKGLWGKGSHHIHVCVAGGDEWKAKIGFRDLLRASNHYKEEYASLKKRLALQHKHDRSLYTKMKEPFILKALEIANRHQR